MRSHSDDSREPCPDRILGDAGSGFAIGAVGGSVYHFVKGSINFPRGERFAGGIQSMRMKVPRTAGSFAVWGGLISTMDCAMVYIRQKEDPWNTILAGAATGGLLQIRAGFIPACFSAAMTGALFAGLEGMTIVASRIHPPPQIEADDPSLMSGMPIPAVQESELKPEWLRGLFEGKNKEGSSSSSSETVILESFDLPTPMPDFEYK